MSKTELKLKEAIEAGNIDEAMKQLAAFSELKNSTDEESNAYFEQIQSLENEDEDEEVLEDEGKDLPSEDKEEDSTEVVEEVQEPVRVEKRGIKAKPKERKSIEKKFDELEADCIDYFAQVKRNPFEAKFARRMVQRLRLIRKQVIKG